MRATQTHIRALRRYLDRHDLEAPTGLARAFADAEAVVARYQDRTPRPLVPAVVAALLEDRDPATDPEVVAAAVDAALAPLNTGGHITAAADQLVAQAAAADADAVVAALRGPFDEAATELAALRAQLPGVALDDLEGASRLGPAAAAALVRARNDAGPAVDAAIAAWGALYRLVRPDQAARLHRPALAWCSPTWPAWLDAGYDRTPPAPWDVVADHDLALATLTEYDGRIAAEAAAKRDAAAERDAAATPRRPSLLPVAVGRR